MTLRTQTNADLDDKDALTASGGHSRPKVNVFVGQVGKGFDPLHKEGLNKIGRAIAIPDFGKESNNERILAGAVKGHQYSIPIESLRELPFTFDQFRLVAMMLAQGSDIAPDYRYASDGQTTITLDSRKSGTVASATGLARKNLMIADTRHATYGGFLEATMLRTVDGSDVTFDPPLDHQPAGAIDFKKIMGKAGGTDSTDIGVQFVDDVEIEYPLVYLVVDEYFPGSQLKLCRFWPEVECLGGPSNSSGTMKTQQLIFRAKQQPEEEFTLMDGTTEYRAWYGKAIWMPV